MIALPRLSLARQFLLASFLILLAGSVVIGLWVGRQIERGVIDNTAAVTALYVESLITPSLQGLAADDELNEKQMLALDSILSDTPLGQSIVLFKLWDPGGRVLYSNQSNLIGQVFPPQQDLTLAFAGQVQSSVSDLSKVENVNERQRWPSLVETYAPVQLEAGGPVVVVAEFYQTSGELLGEIHDAKQRSWLVVAAATLAMYLLLAGLVGRASRMIENQQNQLHESVASLTASLEQNQELHERVSRAAARATALNERFLHRTSADLHDGPAQDLALALLRVEELAESRLNRADAGNEPPAAAGDFRTVQTALQSALAEIRAISAGLRIPELEPLSLAATAARAVGEFESKTGREVTLEINDLPEAAPLPVKITLYRLLQESLANGFRHAGASQQRVELTHCQGELNVRISDNGKGIEPRAIYDTGQLGLAGMRERVEILGGVFTLESEPGRGTDVLASLPLAIPGDAL